VPNNRVLNQRIREDLDKIKEHAKSMSNGYFVSNDGTQRSDVICDLAERVKGFVRELELKED
jgi:hypothetical protein